jgi:hypothetical protein
VNTLTVVTALGWIGAIAGIVAYRMVSKGRWSADSVAFQLTNLGGAAVMFLVAAANGVWPSAAANVAWIVIGAQALVTIARARTKARKAADVGAAADVDLAA